MAGTSHVLCPHCKQTRTYVIDSRLTDRGRRRRYVCELCNLRFSTIEVAWEEYVPLFDAVAKIRKLSKMESVKRLMGIIMESE